MNFPKDGRSLRLQQASTLASYTNTNKYPMINFPKEGDVFWIVLWDNKTLKCMPGTYIGHDFKSRGLRILVPIGDVDKKTSVSEYVGVINVNVFQTQEEAVKQYKTFCENTKQKPGCETCGNAVKVSFNDEYEYSYCEYFYKQVGIPFPCGHICPNYKSNTANGVSLWDDAFSKERKDSQFTVPIPMYNKKGVFVVWVRSFYSNWDKGNLSHIPKDNIFFVEKITCRKIVDGKYVNGHTTVTSYLGKYMTKKELVEKMNNMAN